VEDRDGVPQASGEQPRTTGRGGDEPDAELHQFVDERGVAFDEQRDVGADGAVGEVADPTQVGAALLRGRLDDAQAARIGHRGGQLRPRDEGHGRADDRDVHTGQLAEPVAHEW
jgi:hypothetical protein